MPALGEPPVLRRRCRQSRPSRCRTRRRRAQQQHGDAADPRAWASVHVSRMSWRATMALVPDRLSPLDVSFLYFEEPTTPMHVGGVAVFQAPDERLRLRPAGRPDLATASPSCRATGSGSAGCPGRLANPVWVDDEDFDITYHVRRSALPRRAPTPSCASSSRGCRAARWTATGRCGRCTSSRGSSDGRFAIITKTHHAMVDGIGAVDIGQVILDTSPDPRDAPAGHLAARAGAVLGRAGGRRGRRDRCAVRPALRRHRPRRPVRADARPPAGWSDAAGGLLAAATQRGPGGAGEPAQRGDRRAAALRHGSRSTSTTTAGSARRTAAPSTTSCSRPSPARCAPGC